jgi:Methyltransferase domain
MFRHRRRRHTNASALFKRRSVDYNFSPDYLSSGDPHNRDRTERNSAGPSARAPRNLRFGFSAGSELLDRRCNGGRQPRTDRVLEQRSRSALGRPSREPRPCVAALSATQPRARGDCRRASSRRGCGCGATALEIAGKVGPYGAVPGIDISVPMMARAREPAQIHGIPNLEFLPADASNHEFTNPVDLVFSR